MPDLWSMSKGDQIKVAKEHATRFGRDVREVYGLASGLYMTYVDRAWGVSHNISEDAAWSILSDIKAGKVARSFYATYEAPQGRPCLIGGVRSGRTSRFQSFLDATIRKEDTVAINGGPEACWARVEWSPLPPEILYHPECGTNQAQAIGGLCFKCRHKLTQADAIATKPLG